MEQQLEGMNGTNITPNVSKTHGISHWAAEGSLIQRLLTKV